MCVCSFGDSSLSSQELLINRVLNFGVILIPKIIKKRLEIIRVCFRYHKTEKNPPEVCSMIAVVK